MMHQTIKAEKMRLFEYLVIFCLKILHFTAIASLARHPTETKKRGF